MGRMRYGVNRQLEAQADEMLRRNLASVTAHSEKKDILTPWKQQDRVSREVYVSSGIPDPAIRRGIFGRAYNPVQRHLNSREGIAPPVRNVAAVDMDTLQAHVERFSIGRPEFAIGRDPAEEFDSPDE